MGDALFPLPRRHRGRTETALERQLTAWNRCSGGHLGGDEHAATRRALRGLAEAADAADRDHADGEASAFSRARVYVMLLEALQACSPVDVSGGDELEDALAQLLSEADAARPADAS